jgi:hypothetical protein
VVFPKKESLLSGLHFVLNCGPCTAALSEA